MPFDLSEASPTELLRCYGQILEELRARKILRSSNAPTGDYAEYLVARALRLDLENNSKAGYDATDSAGVRYQIKSRRTTSYNKSKQLSPIRNLEARDFDSLIAVLFNEQFDVTLVVKIPQEIIARYARFNEHVNGHILVLNKILKDALVEDLTPLFRQ